MKIFANEVIQYITSLSFVCVLSMLTLSIGVTGIVTLMHVEISTVHLMVTKTLPHDVLYLVHVSIRMEGGHCS